MQRPVVVGGGDGVVGGVRLLLRQRQLRGGEGRGRGRGRQLLQELVAGAEGLGWARHRGVGLGVGAGVGGVVWHGAGPGKPADNTSITCKSTSSSHNRSQGGNKPH